MANVRETKFEPNSNNLEKTDLSGLRRSKSGGVASDKGKESELHGANSKYQRDVETTQRGSRSKLAESSRISTAYQYERPTYSKICHRSSTRNRKNQFETIPYSGIYRVRTGIYSTVHTGIYRYIQNCTVYGTE